MWCFLGGTRTFCISPNTKHYNKTPLRKIGFFVICISESNTLITFLYILHQLRRNGTQSDGNVHFNSEPRFCPKCSKTLQHDNATATLIEWPSFKAKL